MRKYRKLVTIIIVIELIIVILGNLCYKRYTYKTKDRLYLVEAARITEEISKSGLGGIDVSEYETIIEVKEYNSDIRCDYDYVIEDVEGILYQISYRTVDDSNGLIVLNVTLIFFVVISIFILVYIGRKVIRPFRSMSSMSYDLAKGNLTVPIKEEKSKYFGKFLWGMDMLREKLEENRTKELTLQKEKKMMVLSLSHDIKTPLSAIELYTKALQENLYESEEKRTEVLQGISNNAKEIRKYVDEIISASREDFLNLEVVMGEYYFSEIISAIKLLYEEKLALVHIPFQVADYEDCLLKTDKDRLIEVLQNVIENAIKYGDGKGIGLLFSEEEDCKLITVENLGCTLEEAEITNIFDSFYRGSNSEKVTGNGLGLYICRNLMRKMDGEIYASLSKTEAAADKIFRMTIVVRMR